MTFAKWIDTFVSEKGLDADQILTAEGARGANFIPLSIPIDAIKSAPAQERASIKKMIIKIDSLNQPVIPYFTRLARAIAL